MTYSGDSYKVTVGDLVDPTKQNAMIDNIYQSLNTLDTGKASIDAATTSAAGLVELADDTETQAGTDTTRVVTPAGLKSAVPFKTVAAMNLYVNSGAAFGSWGAGSDSNAGTKVAPFATIVAALLTLPDIPSATIYLAGAPNTFDWKPDGTNGIQFQSGTAGLTVAVASGSLLAVALSGSAVTITLATGGSTIAAIIAAINASATVGPVLIAVPFGNASTNITATLTATALSGGNVRTYAEEIVLSFKGGAISIRGEIQSINLGVRLEKDYSSAVAAIYNNAKSNCSLRCLSIHTTSTALHSRGVYIEGSIYTKCEYVNVSGAWGISSEATGGIAAYASIVGITACRLYNSAQAIYSGYGSTVCVRDCAGGGNSVGMKTLGGIILKPYSNAIGATTSESASPTGSIL